jgi:hypothetical protein|tara:strand:- start:523 stop:1047 length:525 start_codon:yes stop_codon:yes gene_type:complete
MRYLGDALVATLGLAAVITVATTPIWGPPAWHRWTNSSIAKAENMLDGARSSNSPIRYSRTMTYLNNIGNSIIKYQRDRGLDGSQECTDGTKEEGLNGIKFKFYELLGKTHESMTNHAPDNYEEIVVGWRKAADAYSLAFGCAPTDVDTSGLEKTMLDIEEQIRKAVKQNGEDV